jgi:hypothetical protein
MTRLRTVLVVAVLALAAPAALAQLAKKGPSMNAADASRALFGVDMQGYSPSAKFSWRECIDPKGETLYETPGRTQKGKLWVTPDGQACFSYEDTKFQDEFCYRVRKNGSGLMFDGDALGNGVFVTTRLVTGVKSCVPNSDLIS